MTPIDLILFCPKCGMQHVDLAEHWNGKVEVHRSHLCVSEAGGCGHIWRPSDHPTNGVAQIQTKGKEDSPWQLPQKTTTHRTNEFHRPEPYETKFKKGDRIVDAYRTIHGPATVTLITPTGFHYEFDKPYCLHPLLGSVIGGESFTDSHWEYFSG